MGHVFRCHRGQERRAFAALGNVHSQDLRTICARDPVDRSAGSLSVPRRDRDDPGMFERLQSRSRGGRRTPTSEGERFLRLTAFGPRAGYVTQIIQLTLAEDPLAVRRSAGVAMFGKSARQKPTLRRGLGENAAHVFTHYFSTLEG